MKNITPTVVTRLRRNMLRFKPIASLMVVVSEVNREVMSPGKEVHICN